MAIYDQITAELETRKDRSAWGKGVNAYALELVEELKERAEYEGRDPESEKECREWMLNGAQDWEQYSWGGSSLIYNADIAERPGFFKPGRHQGARRGSPPNRSWRWSTATCGSRRGGWASPARPSTNTSSSGGCSATPAFMRTWLPERRAAWSTASPPLPSAAWQTALRICGKRTGTGNRPSVH